MAWLSSRKTIQASRRRSAALVPPPNLIGTGYRPGTGLVEPVQEAATEPESDEPTELTRRVREVFQQSQVMGAAAQTAEPPPPLSRRHLGRRREAPADWHARGSASSDGSGFQLYSQAAGNCVDEDV